ncbi:MAG: flagellar hook-basal body complex protein FliE [Pseudodonghicola sp.]|nr:flagellar hook-basal body complex protein FliE [Pseudodonghicola sp.]
MSDFSSIQPNAAIQAAYGKSKVLTSDAAGGAQLDPAQAQNFAQMIQNAAADAVGTVRDGDATAAAGLTGKAGLQQVVEATMAMESTVKVSVAVRDKLVEAYQEIMRMSL